MIEGQFNSCLTTLDKNEVKRYAGLKNIPFDEKLINQAIDEIIINAVPTGIWRLYDYDTTTRTVLSEPPLPLHGKSITSHLNNTEQVIFLALTIGEAVETAINAAFTAGDYARAVLMDAAATTAVEKIADDLERTLEPKAAARGYKLTWRFSPGYGDWDITAQKRVLPLTGGEKIGLTLTEGLMLLPRKSITAVIGLLPNNNLACPPDKPHDCQACNKTDCPARRI